MESVEDDVPDMVVVHKVDGDPLDALQLYNIIQPNSCDFPVAPSHAEVKGKGFDETAVSQVIESAMCLVGIRRPNVHICVGYSGPSHPRCHLPGDIGNERAHWR